MSSLARCSPRCSRTSGTSREVRDDGGAAWEMFQEAPAPLVILDLNMPVLDGLEVCRRIRAHEAGRETFVLVVTARDGRDDLTAVLDAGADDYVTKPSSPENLRARLEIAARRIAQDRARRAAEAELARARWLAGIGETTIALEHEINNPLSALLGHAELLLMERRADGRPAGAAADHSRAGGAHRRRRAAAGQAQEPAVGGVRRRRADDRPVQGKRENRLTSPPRRDEEETWSTISARTRSTRAASTWRRAARATPTCARCRSSPRSRSTTATRCRSAPSGSTRFREALVGDEDRARARRGARGVRAERRHAGRDEVGARARRAGEGAGALHRARRGRRVLPPGRRDRRRP